MRAWACPHWGPHLSGRRAVAGVRYAAPAAGRGEAA